MNEKDTTTNLKTVLSQTELSTLAKASKDWKTFDKNALSIRTKMYSIGKGLNLLYIKLKAKGVKRDEIARLVLEYFPDMDKQFRSDVRKVSNLFPDIEKWADKHYKKGFNPNSLIIHFTRYQNSLDKVYKHFGTVQYEPDLYGNVKNLGYDLEADIFFFTDLTLPTGKRSKVTDKGLEVVDQTLKHNIEAVNPSKVTVQDFKGLTDKFFNNALNLYNSDKFFATDKDMEVLTHIVKRAKAFIEYTKISIDVELEKAA